jgi:ligand-binding sensor domain-containing protein
MRGCLQLPYSNWKRIVYRTVWAIAFVILLSGNTKPEHLPIKTYTTSEGLAQNSVNRIVRDSRGFLWFCTEGGLSRYDGYSFTNYAVEQGLPDSQVRDLLETREGEYFVGGVSGVCRFNPKGRPSATDQRNTPPASGLRTTSDGRSNVRPLPHER